MERVLVTGGAGYLGSVMVGHLLQCGYHVTVLDNLLYGHPSLLGYCNDPRFDFTLGDCRDERVLSGLVKQHDVLIPLAAIVGAPACDRVLHGHSVNRAVGYWVIAHAAVGRLSNDQQRQDSIGDLYRTIRPPAGIRQAQHYHTAIGDRFVCRRAANSLVNHFV
jgi:nucleoside-diphosphate-sugar epimerase